MKRTYKNSIQLIWVLLLLIVVHSSALAQQKNTQKKEAKKDYFKYSIEAICRNYGDSIVIRWAPNNPAIWMLSNKAGYKIDKVQYINDSAYSDKALSHKPLKPLSKKEMIARYKNEKHPYGMVATQFLYGEVDLSEDGKTGIVASIRNADDEQNMRYAYTLQAADFDADVANSLGLRYVYYPKKDTDSIYEFRVHSLIKSEYVFPGICRVAKNDIYKNDAKPERVIAQPIENGVRVYWNNGKFSAYFIERSTDGINFKPLNKKPYITSHMDEKEIGDASVRKLEVPDSLRAQAPKYINMIKQYQFYTDKLPNTNQKFYYRVRGIDAFGEMSKYSKVVSAKGINPIVNRAPRNVKVVRTGKGTFKISWDKPKKEGTLKGYAILVKHSLGEEDKLLKQELIPLATTEFIHTGVKEGELNIYSVVSVDERGKFYKAIGKVGYEKDKTPPAVPKGLYASFDKTGMSLITWDKNKEDDIKGYKVYIRYHIGDDWIQITNLPVKDPYLFDIRELKTLTRKVYYSVVAVDYSDNHSDFSKGVEAVLPDIVPPVAPVTESYKLYDGVLKVVYIASSSNDVKAHHLYRKEKGSDWKLLKSFDLSQINNGKIYITQDNIARNVNYIYALQAEDLSGLKSKMSDHLPIVIRGVEPENIDIKLSAKFEGKNNNVVFAWNKPLLKHHKKYHFVLYKKEEGKDWKMVNSFGQNKLSGVDYKIKKGKEYAYKIAVFVKGTEMTISKPISVKIK